MSATQKEPVAVSTLIRTLLALAVLYGVLDAGKAAGWEALAVAAIPVADLVLGWWTRSRVFSPNTIRQAGLDPEAVQDAADDPRVAPLPEPRP